MWENSKNVHEKHCIAVVVLNYVSYDEFQYLREFS